MSLMQYVKAIAGDMWVVIDPPPFGKQHMGGSEKVHHDIFIIIIIIIIVIVKLLLTVMKLLFDPGSAAFLLPGASGDHHCLRSG